MRRFVAAALVLVLALPMGLTVFASQDNTAMAPRWTATRTLSVSLDRQGNTLEVFAEARSKNDDQDVRLIAELQRYDGGWEKVCSWEQESAVRCTIDVSRTVTSGYRYRVNAVAEIYEGKDLVERATKTSTTVSM